MKQRYKIMTIAAITLFAVVLSVLAFTVDMTLGIREYSGVARAEENGESIEMGSDTLKILQLTDVQFQHYLEEIAALSAVKMAIDKAKPDLIIFTGDNLHDNATEDQLRLFVDFIDKFKTPWAIVLGNHDYGNNVPVEKQCEVFSKSEYCLFRVGEVAGYHGNYSIKLKHRGEIVYSLILMDTKSNGFSLEQVIWYESTVKEINEEAGGRTVPSLAFFHIPTKETEIAAELYEKGELCGSGVIREAVCAQREDVGFFEKVLELGSTRALIYGHDHLNSAIFDYKGITLAYGLKTGMTVAPHPDLQGGNLITVNANGDFSIERIFIR